MIAVDVNLLIYAHRRDQVHHEFYRAYLESTISAGDALGLSPLVASGFVRIGDELLLDQPRSFTLATDLRTLQAVQLFRETCGGCPARRHRRRKRVYVGDRDRDFELFIRHGLRLQLLEP